MSSSPPPTADGPWRVENSSASAAEATSVTTNNVQFCHFHALGKIMALQDELRYAFAFMQAPIFVTRTHQQRHDFTAVVCINYACTHMHVVLARQARP